VPEKYVSVDGNATFLRHTGPTVRPDAPPDVSRGEVVLCLHGALYSSASFASALPALAREHSPLAFDFPGHGRSGGIDSLGSVERQAHYARALASKLGLRPAVLLGHGLGAAVALEYALAFPDDVRALALANAAARFDVDAALLDRLRRVSEGKDRRFFRKELYSRNAAREILGAAFAEEMKTDPRVVLGDLLALAEWNAESRRAAISQPTLVLSGADESKRAGQAARALVWASRARARR
jgi:pimeloyl-ACP methyl ester carboxylesterase